MTETTAYTAIKNYYTIECGIEQNAAERLANYACNIIEMVNPGFETEWVIIRGIRNAFFDGQRFA